MSEHASSKQHKAEVESELLRRVSVFHAESEKQEEVQDTVYFNAFLAMYWLAKEEIANKKIFSFLGVLEQLGLSNIKYFEHRSAGSA